MQFEARVLDSQQNIQTLKLEAFDTTDVQAQLLARQLTLLSAKASGDPWQLPLGRSRTNRFDLLLFTQELHALISAGLSVVEALEALIERAVQEHLRSILQRLLMHLREGNRLSGAMAFQSEVFPALFRGVVQAAEGTSDLPRALERYISYETRLQTLKHKITSAAIYPSILMSVGGGVAVFTGLCGAPVFCCLPGQYSSIAMGLANAVELGAICLSLRHLAGGELCKHPGCSGLLAHRSVRSGSWWHLLAWLPGARLRLQILELSRLYMTLGMLLEGGISITKAMQFAEAVVTGARVQALQTACQAVGFGDKLSNALEQQGLSTPVALRLLRVGEQTGQLGLMLSRTAAFYDNETTRWIERFTKAFEPILMAAIGIVIGLIVILLYMPIFDLAGNLQ